MAYYKDIDGSTQLLDIHFGQRSCSTFNYTIYSYRLLNGSFHRIIQLSTTLPTANFGYPTYYQDVDVEILPCPFGFAMNVNQGICDCNTLLKKGQFVCDINRQTILRNGSVWVGNTSFGIGFHPHCPLFYCIQEPSQVLLNDSDMQCSNNHSGILCGKCKEGFSITFGTSQCRKSSNYYVTLVVLFALMGVALVVVIFVLDFTVTNGTVCSLIYYANIIKVNDSIFFPPSSQSNRFLDFLFILVAWLNADFGFQACFYNGMDTYSKTWLQFLFPIFIFVLIGSIIIFGKFSSKVSQIFKTNAVPVLATLLLFSYSKLLRTVIAIFSSTTLTLENSTLLVWLYDSNIVFLKGKHIPLLVAAFMVSAVFLIPFTVLLLFATCLQKISSQRVSHWIVSLKPLIDVYHAP